MESKLNLTRAGDGGRGQHGQGAEAGAAARVKLSGIEHSHRHNS